MLHDLLEDSKYTVSAAPQLKLEEKRTKSDLYAVDQERGCVVDLDISRDEEAYKLDVETPTGTVIKIKLKTDPALMCDITQGAILQEAFKIKPEARTLLAALFFGSLFGFFFGLMF